MEAGKGTDGSGLSLGLDRLPEGTLTFLLTDMEGSREHSEVSPGVIRPTMARQDDIVAGYVERHRGIDVRRGRAGGRTLSVFGRATEAAAAALAMQRAFSSEAGMRIRIALHAGEAQLRDGLYHRQALNRCASLLATGHAGQILLTQAVEELLVDHLPAGAALRDLGYHRLKDQPRPEHVFELVDPANARQFPAIRSVRPAVTSRPALTSFVGRKREIREVRALVRRTRLTTLAGPGGSGKTRLALAAAEGLVNEFSDGVFVAELAPLSEARLIQQAVAGALQLPEQPGRPMLATIADYLRTRHVLLVLDNCEHLLAEAAALADTMVRSCEELHVLATSRVRLAIDGEQVWSVPELNEPEALALFIERAGDARRGFAVTDANRQFVIKICRRLDGMPLAIELAAARLRILPLEQIDARLQDRFTLLTGGSRTALPRHQSLEAATEWSHELLPPSAQELWHRLSVFSGGFRLEAAEAICAAGALAAGQILDQLQALIDASLIQAVEGNGTRRYHMLETIRAYGWRRLLGDGAADEIQRRHLHWFLELARRAEPEWRGPNQSQWLNRVDEDLDNVRAALDFSRSAPDLVDGGLSLASSLWLYWHSRGHMGEGRQWIEGLLKLAPKGRARAYGLNVAGFMAYVQGDAEQAVPLLEASLELNRELGNKAAVNFSLMRLGIALLYKNDLDRSVEVLESALLNYRAAGDRIGTYVSAYELAEALTMRGDFDRSAILHRESLGLKQQQGDVFHLGLSHFGLGLLAWRTGDFAEAQRQLHKAIEYRQQIQEWWGITGAIEALGWVATDAGEPERAVQLLGAAAALYERIGTRSSPHYAVHHDRVLTRLKSALSEDKVARLWARGYAFSFEEAIEFATSGAIGSISPKKAVGGVSRREQDVARLVAEGLTNRQIARRLALAERTVDAHLEHIMNKLGFRSRAQVAAWVTTRPPPPL